MLLNSKQRMFGSEVKAFLDFFKGPSAAAVNVGPGCGVAKDWHTEASGAGRGRTVRIMTYNVHSCMGTDGRTSPYRIAGIIAAHSPDIVALQELDACRARTGRIHQAEEIAAHLNMAFHFHPSFEIREEKFGNAVLSRFPMKLIQAGALPSFQRRRPLERRGALWTSIRCHGAEVQLINTHFGLRRRERLLQAECLLGPEWAAHSSCRPPLVICGDFNALPLSRVYRRFRESLLDAQTLNGSRPENTYPSRYPAVRIDHVFLSGGLNALRTHVPGNAATRAASDHLPLIIDIGFGEDAQRI